MSLGVKVRRHLGPLGQRHGGLHPTEHSEDQGEQARDDRRSRHPEM